MSKHRALQGLTPAERRSLAAAHGKHPMRGYPVTWHLTPVRGGPGIPVTFLLERADGDEPTRHAFEDLVSTERARELVQRLTADR